MDRSDLRAIGICGKDGGLLKVEKKYADGTDIGYVGQIREVNPQIIYDLLEKDFIPIIPDLSTHLLISLPPPCTMIGLNPTSFKSATSSITLRVNRNLVRMVEELGVRAIGICGKDGGLLKVEKKYNFPVEFLDIRQCFDQYFCLVQIFLHIIIHFPILQSKQQAQTLAKSIVCSNLTKTAIAGHDANWGRILCAMGYSGAQFDPEKVDLFFESKASPHGALLQISGNFLFRF